VASSTTPPIWRYMDLVRFVSILATRSLWFAKASRFGDDPWEAFCRPEARPIPADGAGEGFQIIHTDSSGTRPVTLEQWAADWSRLAAESFERSREHLYINSWCLADESMAMWEIYGSAGRGVAVRSSVRRYKRAAKFGIPESQYDCRDVEYRRDFESCSAVRPDFTREIPVPGFGTWSRMLKLAFLKRVCFEHEKEWRAVLYQGDRPEITGCLVECDLDELIDAVYVGPRAEGFLYDVVQSIMD
jgi:hypothetical protein